MSTNGWLRGSNDCLPPTKITNNKNNTQTKENSSGKALDYKSETAKTLQVSKIEDGYIESTGSILSVLHHPSVKSNLAPGEILSEKCYPVEKRRAGKP